MDTNGQSNKGKDGKDLRAFGRLLRHVLPYGDKVAVTVLGNALQIAVGIAHPLITKTLIDVALPNKDIYLLNILILSFLAVSVIEFFLNQCLVYLNIWVRNSVISEFSSKCYRNLQRMSLRFFDREHTGTLMYRLTADIFEVSGMVTNAIPSMVSVTVTLAVLLLICLNMDIKLTLLALLPLPLYYILSVKLTGKMVTLMEKSRTENTKVQAQLQESLIAVRVIKALTAEPHEREKYKLGIKKRIGAQHRAMLMTTFISLLDNFCIAVWGIMITWYAGYHVITGVLTIGGLVAITMYILRLSEPIRGYFELYRQVKNGLVSGKKVLELLDSAPEIIDDPKAVDILPTHGVVTFNNVGFAYEPKQMILKDVSFEIPAGKKLALVGASGVGKTTVASLLMRFYDPVSGTIHVDGRDIRKIKLATHRSSIGFVMQEAILFSGTVKDNIRYIKRDATDEEIMAAADKACANDFIMSLLKGYDTEIGERGVMLSAGQRQRIHISRLFLSNPKILIFDEATSALDVETELELMSSIRNLTQDKTTLIIAHRLSTLRYVDLVLVLQNGRVAEFGTMSELLKNKGLFYKYYTLQLNGALV